MQYSKYNIFSGIRNSENYFIVNLLSGSADILTPSDANKLDILRSGKALDDGIFLEELKDKGYFIEEAEEKSLYRSKYLDFLDSRDDDEVQLFFVANYSCNFSCSYCYQSQYTNSENKYDYNVTDAFFDYVIKEFSGRRKYITIFGGEPLLNSKNSKDHLLYFLKKTKELDIEVSIVTNGYYLEDYADILSHGIIREIQVTLDGTEAVHNNRRFLKNGGATFEKIVRGIDSCIESNININLRMVVDKDNMDNLPELARFAIDKGWTKCNRFKTQIGRNYELHQCQLSHERLFDRVSLYESIYELIKQHPYIQEFYKPAYSVSKFLFENGELPDPLFDSCPACKTEWAFDYTGNIYSCTATVGKEDESLGTFYPSVSRKDDVIEQWERRDVTSIPECIDCPVQLACGGGCGSVAKNRTGSICSSDCRPVKELLEIGFSAYSGVN